MESGKNTKTGVLSWTPAPKCVSPATSETSEDAWDEEEEQDDDFYAQMEENGIIGLTLVDDPRDAECNGTSSRGPATPEGLAICVVPDMPPDELCSTLDEHLEDVLSPFCDDVCVLKERGHHQAKANERETPKGRKTEQRFSERDSQFDTAQGERDGTEGEWTLRNGPVNNSKESERSSERQFCESPSLIVEANGDCKPRCPTQRASSRPTLPMFSHLCRFTLEEMAAAPGIASETVPDMCFTDFPDTHSLMSCVSSLHHQESSEEEEDQEDALSAQPQSSENSQTGLKKPAPSPGPRSQPRHDAALPRTSSHDKPKEDCHHALRRADECRKAYPNHGVPDLSKVKPRVSFPKGDYKPPKSRWSSKNPPKSLTPEAPVVFKSPADIVKEVLLNTTDGPQPPLDLNKRASAGTVPQEFLSQQKAGILLDQLQEDHGRLLTKYAEAANTIDRLRLEAKVNLYSEQQMPAHAVPSGQHAEPSKFMRLDFPQAQKAQPGAVSPPPSGPSTHIRASSSLFLSSSISKSLESPGNRRVANALFAQADKFLQQLQHFEEFLKSKMPFQMVKGLAQLYQGLDSLEKGYLAARKEHKVQQQQGAEHSHFDPNRELEEFIYQCGRHMDELKERVDRNSRAADSARSLSPEAPKSPACDDSHVESQHTPLSLDSVELPNKEVGPGNVNSSHFKKRCDEQATDVDQSATARLTPTPASSRRRKEVRKSYSSSQCSLAEISASEKRSANLQTGMRRVLSQDGGISPGTDSGFVGSECSHQIWAATHDPCQQRASKRVSGPAEVSSVKPQTIRTSTPSRDSSQSHRRTSREPNEYFQQAMRGSCPGERTQRQRVHHQTDSIRTDSEITHPVSDDIQSDQYEETLLPCSSPSSSCSTVRHHHSDSLKTLRSSERVTCNESSLASQSFKSNAPARIGESPTSKPLSGTNSTPGNSTQHRTSHALRCRDHSSDVSRSSRKKWSIDGNEVEKVTRRTARKRLTHKQQTRRDTTTATEDENAAQRLLVSRSTQTSIAATDIQLSYASDQVQHIKRDNAERADDNDGRTSGVLPCSQCLSHHKVSPESGHREPAQFCSCHCHRCHHCRHSETKTANEQDCCRDSNTSKISSCTTSESPNKAAPPAVCPSLCPTPLLLYLQPQPVHVCTNNTGSPSKVDSSKEEERLRPSPCVVPERSVDDALLAAQKIKDVSKRMVRSLTAGMRSLERLSKSRSNSNSD
ncbi:uncharacterized protein LOC127591189 isoform X2 [Hippocampus zosterae]|uniref:uncharacterized protein LOC127591189 isoform X2 n=1 Tax=Hippocampus zosterae TaxID=109293 RepID=UPI00223CA2CE|nr:uncharacterized protein LOC127591189 isoform X2 [Hippocampus zosterae]